MLKLPSKRKLYFFKLLPKPNKVNQNIKNFNSIIFLCICFNLSHRNITPIINFYTYYKAQKTTLLRKS